MVSVYSKCVIMQEHNTLSYVVVSLGNWLQIDNIIIEIGY